MQIRPFRNSDPPAIVEFWRRLPPLEARAQSLTVSQLEQHVFAKPYFDRLGLFVADDGGATTSFAHAGFGTNETHSNVDLTLGVLSMLACPPDEAFDSLAAELIASAETYLGERGAMRVLAGGVSPHHPFYLGFYGGAQLPGILASDERTLLRYESAGYKPAGERRVCRCSLVGYRPPVDRNLMRVRRSFRLEFGEAPTYGNWWDACTLGSLHPRRFQLCARFGGGPDYWIDVWDMEPLASSWGRHAMGLCRWSTTPTHDNLLPFLFLLGETMKQLSSEGIGIFELQLDPAQAVQAELCARLGLYKADTGHILEKKLSSA